MSKTQHLHYSTVDVAQLAPSVANGRKFDMGKLEYDLIPPYALEEMVKVLTTGAQKYAADNWRMVPEANRRYFAAAQRHLWAWKRGEIKDAETGIHHLAHAACNLFFLYEHDVGLCLSK